MHDIYITQLGLIYLHNSVLYKPLYANSKAKSLLGYSAIYVKENNRSQVYKLQKSKRIDMHDS